MSQQKLDLRRSLQIARRYKRLLSVTIVSGLLIGAAYAVIAPPKLSSTALVLLPQALVQSSQGSSTDGGLNIATQVVIAGSDTVLADALPAVSPRMSLQALQSKVQIQNVAGSILSISASGGTAQQAETTANAVAKSYIAYVGSPDSPVGQVSARMLEAATTATGSKLPEQIVIFGLLGVIAGALVGFVVALAIGRGERRLTERDAIANSIGVPVLASFPVGHPSNAASWVKLLEEYDPGVVHAWSLGKLLRQFGVTSKEVNGAPRVNILSLTILSFSTDAGALALGPQLAAYAASQGIPTVLVVDSQVDESATATLRIACAEPLPSAVDGRRPLQLAVSGDDIEGMLPAFVVMVTVVDGRVPALTDAARTNATVIGVSAGAVTAEQLARAATSAATVGHDVVGILVADPDPDDQTSGRIPDLGPAVRRSVPTRVRDISTEIRR